MEKAEQGKKDSSQKLNLFGLCVFGIGIIIGAGVYAILGIAASQSGTTLALSFLMAAVVALLTGLSYCELGTLFPKAAAFGGYLQEFVKIPVIFPQSLLRPSLSHTAYTSLS